MSDRDDTPPGPSALGSPATSDAGAVDVVPSSPSVTAGAHEVAYPDSQPRLSRNVSRRSDARWEPLTYLAPAPAPPD